MEMDQIVAAQKLTADFCLQRDYVSINFSRKFNPFVAFSNPGFPKFSTLVDSVVKIRGAVPSVADSLVHSNQEWARWLRLTNSMIRFLSVIDSASISLLEIRLPNSTLVTLFI